MSTKYLEARDICRTYSLGAGKIAALDSVSIGIEAGEMVAICGPSGSGKSTLLHLLGCLDRPDRGEILLDGEHLPYESDESLAELRSRKIGFIFQAYNLIDVLTAIENVSLPLLNHSVHRHERNERAAKALASVGLGAFTARYPGQLSGGQQQRVGVARALVTEPLLVIGDEITANLDSTTSTEILELLVSINRERGTTFVFATHDRRMLKYMTRVLWMEDGTFADEWRGAAEIRKGLEQKL